MIAVFFFYNECDTSFHRILSFSKHFKHVNLLMYDGDMSYFIQSGKHGLDIKAYNCDDIVSTINNFRLHKNCSAVVSTSISQRRNISNFPFGGIVCNEVCRYVSGIDIGLTLNPKHLYNKLLSKNKSNKNFDILYTWRKK